MLSFTILFSFLPLVDHVLAAQVQEAVVCLCCSQPSPVFVYTVLHTSSLNTLSSCPDWLLNALPGFKDRVPVRRVFYFQ